MSFFKGKWPAKGRAERSSRDTLLSPSAEGRNFTLQKIKTEE